jgi:tRNA U55 pseudouridine synthase TruB
MGNVEKALLPLDFPFQNMGGMVLNQEYINNLIHGRSLPLKELKSKSLNFVTEPVDGKIVPVYTTKGEFIGLGRLETDNIYNSILKPEKIIK